MAIADFKAIWELADSVCDSAEHIADRVIQLSEHTRGKLVKYAKAHSITNLPKVAGMNVGYGMKAWAAIMSVDMVGSSNRAVRIGARDTYITMHTYLPVMAEIASKKGFVVGLRGDGLFAAYGLTELTGTNKEVSPETAHEAVGNASRTGQAMIEAAEEVIGPILERKRIEGGIGVRIGVHIGPIVVTRIGLGSAQEVTAYGPAVNTACKMGTAGRVTVTHDANRVWTGREGGKISRSRAGNDWRLDFADLKMLNR